jgi:hypothetical protein
MLCSGNICRVFHNPGTVGSIGVLSHRLLTVLSISASFGNLPRTAASTQHSYFRCSNLWQSEGVYRTWVLWDTPYIKCNVVTGKLDVVSLLLMTSHAGCRSRWWLVLMWLATLCRCLPGLCHEFYVTVMWTRVRQGKLHQLRSECRRNGELILDHTRRIYGVIFHSPVALSLRKGRWYPR